MTDGARIEVGQAWNLVRALSESSGDAPAGDPPLEVRRASAGDTWVELHPDGAWEISHEPTAAAWRLLDLYLPVLAPDTMVIGQLGQSLDGRIATESGASHFVTGPEDIERLHRLRALVDAVVVGAGTVAADDPRLTVRAVVGRDPVRVVIDPEGRLDSRLRVFADGSARTIRVRRAPPDSEGCDWHADVLLVPAEPDGSLDLVALLHALRDERLARILIEGGGITVSRFLAAGLLDRLHVTVAPLLIGSGRPSLTLDPIESLDLAIRPACRLFRLGDDVLFDLDLRNSGAGA